MLNRKKIIKKTAVDFDYKDPFRLTDQLTNEEIQIKDLSHEFAKKELLTKIVHQNRYEKFDKFHSSL